MDVKSWDNSTPIREIVSAIEGLSEEEKKESTTSLEQNLILNFGLLKRLSEDRIERMKLPDRAIRFLKEIVSQPKDKKDPSQLFVYDSITYNNKPFQKGSMGKCPFGLNGRNTQSGDESSCPFLFVQYMQEKRKLQKEPTKFSDESSSAEESETESSEELSQNDDADIEDESDSEDSLDKYITSLGFPKSKGPSCPFIFQRMMIERRRMMNEAEKNNNQDPVIDSMLSNTNSEINTQDISKCPHMASKLNKNPEPAFDSQDISKCPHMASKLSNTNSDPHMASKLNKNPEPIFDSQDISKCPHMASKLNKNPEPVFDSQDISKCPHMASKNTQTASHPDITEKNNLKQMLDQLDDSKRKEALTKCPHLAKLF